MVQVSGILHTIPSMHAGKKNHLLFVCCLLCTSPPLFFTGPFTAHTVLSHYKINPYLAHLIITKDIYYAASILVIFFVTVTIMDANNHLAFRNHAILFFQPRFDYYGINGRHPICCTVIKVYSVNQIVFAWSKEQSWRQVISIYSQKSSVKRECLLYFKLHRWNKMASNVEVTVLWV